MNHTKSYRAQVSRVAVRLEVEDQQEISENGAGENKKKKPSNGASEGLLMRGPNTYRKPEE